VKSVDREDHPVPVPVPVPVPEVEIAKAVKMDNLKDKYHHIFKNAPVSRQDWKRKKEDTDKMQKWEKEVNELFPKLVNLSECPLCEKPANPEKRSNLKRHTIKLHCQWDKVFKIPLEEEKDGEDNIEIRQEDKVADDDHAKVPDDSHAKIANSKINQESILNTNDKHIYKSLCQR
jgi:hypothetical protein